MNPHTRLTKAQLIERINQLEAEVDALYVEQRPSRTAVGHITRYTDRQGNIWEKTRAPGAKVATLVCVGRQQ